MAGPDLHLQGQHCKVLSQSEKSRLANVSRRRGDTRRFFSNLVGNGKEARSFKVASLDDLEAKADELAASLLAWCEMKDGG